MPAVKNVGEPCAGEPHARIDGGREETKHQSAPAARSQAPLAYPTNLRREHLLGRKSGSVTCLLIVRGLQAAGHCRFVAKENLDHK
jgi:hypothetical protein